MPVLGLGHVQVMCTIATMIAPQATLTHDGFNIGLFRVRHGGLSLLSKYCRWRVMQVATSMAVPPATRILRQHLTPSSDAGEAIANFRFRLLARHADGCDLSSGTGQGRTVDNGGIYTGANSLIEAGPMAESPYGG